MENILGENFQDAINFLNRIAQKSKKDKDKNITSTISRKDSRRISKSRKGTIHRIKEDDKTDEKTGIRRKSIHRIIKKHPSAKKLIKRLLLN